MDTSLFGSKSTGHLVDTPNNVKAFVPNALPPELDLASLIVPLQNARDAIAELRGASRRLGNPYILVRPLQRREALTSSAMEGTFTTDDDLLIADAGMDEASDQASIEVRNYLRALSESLRMLQEDGLPICHKVIRTAHDILLSGVGSHRGANRNRGSYKTEQNAIGGVRRGIEHARFVPPPPTETEKCMDQLEAYINRPNRDETPPLIDMALAHYQLEAIHPFSDGNGRVGRMLISLMAVERGLFETPLLYVSPELEGRKDEYIDLMLAVSTNGAWNDWISFFLDIVEDSARSSIQVVDRLISLQASYRERVTLATKAANAVALVDMLFDSPIVRVRDVQDAFGVTYRAARNTIDKLIEQGVLVEVSRLHPTVFIAPEIMKVADRE
ncbi:Fic family protein [Roseobacter sp. HKCCD9010]|uniref:Fic family protein n=1 Tax=unclassified Roseobacter TaxID=196798 RepID=UPI00149261A9|nr:MULTISPECIES: Fic family protein [unclassified Roseobacter]MBF9050934.1 Fic family protein [Rhodobacterales bacterium HKCCD4356]NNV69297.1 Fic family protein [Roseobacter sp. HKCCD8474]NNW02818.1 Fic family protein [Roseobacter sp. HKCCD9022]NNW15982.1 Fic family protein [Roseobacter sp. HKCCD8832]NNW24202.1 Fic family protein [Roseobacter sp. HKCCD5929]NNW41543.1 Fic family protein [Roseobacter sp. HKCCD8654]NNW67421.1 Fic family protein [Roseobacter sp. HKCCD8473]NNW80049.1 Fic family 